MISRKVLIVEDEMIVQMHLRRIISDIGHEVVGTAATTAEALAIALEHPPEIVLMDIHLAQGDDGVDTARLLSDRHDCAVIFVTAYADDKTIERTAEVDAAGYLVKPFSDANIRAAISTAAAGHGRRRKEREREKSLSSVLVTMGDAIFTTDATGLVTFANPRAADLLEQPIHAISERKLTETLHFVTAADDEALASTLETALRDARSESFSQLELVTPAGREIAVEIDIEPVIENGRATGLIVVLRDRSKQDAPRPTGTLEKRPFGADTRLLVYSHDTFGLGHLRRSLNLIRELVQEFPGLSALLVTGSPMVHRYTMPMGADYLKLPAVQKVASEQYEARSLSITGSDIHTLRSNLLLRTIRDYDPNVLLVDHSPVGMKGEMRPSLDWLTNQGTCTCILGLRDIIDRPAYVQELWHREGIYDVLRDLYDHVVVYGTKAVYDPVKEYGFPDELAAKTHFVNYVCDPGEAIAEMTDTQYDVPLVAVSIGGGDGGGDKVIGTFLDMFARYRDKIEYRAQILTGPFVSPELERELRAKAEGLPVTLETFVPSTKPLFREAALVVSTTGYNTATDLLAHARRAVLIPRFLYRHEQVIRARRMEELGLVTCLHPDEVTPESLFDAIRASLDGPEKLTLARKDKRIPLDGAQRFANFCRSLEVTSLRPT